MHIEYHANIRFVFKIERCILNNAVYSEIKPNGIDLY